MSKELADDMGEVAVFAEGVGPLAMIRRDLEQSLLESGGSWERVRLSAEQALAREFEGLVFL